QLLPPGTSLRGPKLRTIYYSDLTGNFLRSERTNAITFEARDVYYTFNNGRTGLVDFNMFETSGRLIGLMGASGTGKSTLLEVLNGNVTPNAGRVLINGYDVHHQREEILGVIGYVPQDDLLIEQLTVWENLYYAARLSFGQEPNSKIRMIVDKVLHDLGLFEIQDLRVGSPLNKTISGGQRKRLNIGLELLREPSVLFVDEPTSGLSSRDSLNIMELLKELATKGKLVFVVIHQPSSEIFKMFDRLHILDQGGYPIYYGDPVEALIYFKGQADQIDKDEAECVRCGNVKTEQIFEIIESRIKNEYGKVTEERKVTPLDWYQKFKDQRVLPRLSHIREKVPVSTKIASTWEQLSIFFERDVKSKISNPQYLALVLLEAPLLALVLAYICKFYAADQYVFSENENIPVFIFMSIIVSIFMGLTVSAEEIYRDRKILKRESFLHLSWGSYLLSKVLILAVIAALQTLTFLMIGHNILEFKGMFWVHFAVLFSTGLFSSLLGLNISSAFNSAVTIYILIPILLIPQLVLGGIVVRFDNLHPRLRPVDGVPLVADVMASRWGYEALMVSQYQRNAYEAPFFALDQQIYQAYYKKNFLIPQVSNKVALLADAQHNEGVDTLRYQQDWRRVVYTMEKESVQSGLEIPIQPLPATWLDVTPLQWDELKTYSESLRKYFVRRYNAINRNKDSRIAELTITQQDREEFLQKRTSYTNEAVIAFVENMVTDERISEAPGRFIQNIYPIFKPPVTDRKTVFSTHFFSSTKLLFGWELNTLHANLIMIWIFTVFLFGLLYVNFLRAIVRFRYQDVFITVARRQAMVWGKRLFPKRAPQSEGLRS
ncbi:MAG TPA: ABC transporter ATP-binding protein, partial [Cytophagales bacterium]|nr:ABC transporter ATP-binding protein [Cytophagales bacterium]